MEEKTIKTGTTTVGIVCKDGIILAADKRATAGHMIASKKADKVHQIDDNIGVTIAGSVSEAQFLVKLIRAEIKLRKVRITGTITTKEAANLLASLNYASIRRPSMILSIVGFLLGGYDKTGFHLYEIGVDGSILEDDRFISDGSGSVFALGVLETLWKKDMTIQEGIELAKKSINAAFQRDSASGDGVDIVKITKDGFEKALHQKIEVRLN